jgi:hypothetical protein
MKKFIITTALASLAILSACNDADVASTNLSTAADNFKIMRKITVINDITDNVLLTVEGLCSLGNNDPIRLPSLTCKDEHGQFKKDFIGMGDNTSYIIEQLDPIDVSVYHYKVIIKPSVLIPSVELK